MHLSNLEVDPSVTVCLHNGEDLIDGEGLVVGHIEVLHVVDMQSLPNTAAKIPEEVHGHVLY